MQLIRDHSNIDQWHYVNTAENPADFASRGLDVNQKKKVKRWFQGPSFLWQNQDTWNVVETTPELSMNDPEVKKQVVVNAVQTNWNGELLSRILKTTTDWNKLKRIMAFVIKFVQQLKNKVDCDSLSSDVLSVKLLNEAEAKMVQVVQEESFGREIDILKSNESSIIPKSSSIHKLDVFLDIRGILNVGGRLKNSF